MLYGVAGKSLSLLSIFMTSIACLAGRSQFDLYLSIKTAKTRDNHTLFNFIKGFVKAFKFFIKQQPRDAYLHGRKTCLFA